MRRLTFLALAAPLWAAAAEQLALPALDALPALPQPYLLRDWKKTACDFDAVAFDFSRRGQYLPLPWWDTTRVNIGRDILALPAYIGHGEQTAASPGNYETITCLAALVSATRVGIDKAPAGGTNWVELATGYFSSRNGANLYLNRTDASTGESFWYELLPSILFYQLYDGYRSTPGMPAQFRITADRWVEACRGMGGSITPWTLPDFDHTAFNLKTGKPLDNGKWKEADAAAAVAWIETLAASHLGDKRYCDAAEWGLQYLDTCRTNPLYECLLPFGALAAARANAERGTRHDVGKLLNWCFDGSNPRKWGMLNQRFGDTDCHGLIGSVYPDCQFAFAMNTFSMAGALAPVARYDTRYAAALGKWLLNVAVRSRLFYPDAWPAEYQTGLDWQRQNLPENCIAYEGLREQGLRRTYTATSPPQPVVTKLPQRPYAAGDPTFLGWGKTDFGLYGSAFVGQLAALVETTEVEGVLRFDLLATDSFIPPSWPTYLYYNPHPAAKRVTCPLAPGAIALYDAAAHRFIARNAGGKAALDIPGGGARVLVLCPEKGAFKTVAGRLSCDGRVIDYRAPAQQK
ncbi:MAG: hypothetical protein WCK89_09845 [bacterium]